MIVSLIVEAQDLQPGDIVVAWLNDSDLITPPPPCGSLIGSVHSESRDDWQIVLGFPTLGRWWFAMTDQRVEVVRAVQPVNPWLRIDELLPIGLWIGETP